MKESKQQFIPIHRMDALSPLGIEFNYMDVTAESVKNMTKLDKNAIHRDDYFMFLFMETASATFSVDFEEIKLQGESIFYVRPGQVHFVPWVKEAKGWSLAIDAMLIDKSYKNVFESQFATQKPIPLLDVSVMKRIRETAGLLRSTVQAKQTAFSNGLILNLANVFIGTIAEQYAQQQEGLQYNKSRSAFIVHQFKELLSNNFKTIKSPSQYAKMLNYSLAHLNESVKNVTGFPVSYWIHEQVILEAKRLLYYTNMDVKEIAFSLGYEDHTYFSRLFPKIVGLSPKVFRCKFRE